MSWFSKKEEPKLTVEEVIERNTNPDASQNAGEQVNALMYQQLTPEEKAEINPIIKQKAEDLVNGQDTGQSY